MKTECQEIYLKYYYLIATLFLAKQSLDPQQTKAEMHHRWMNSLEHSKNWRRKKNRNWQEGNVTKWQKNLQMTNGKRSIFVGAKCDFAIWTKADKLLDEDQMEMAFVL